MNEDILNESGFEEERDSFMQPPTRSLRNFALVKKNNGRQKILKKSGSQS